MNLIDSHCHIDFTEFDHDREAVLKNAHKLGVTTIVVPAVAFSTWSRLISMTENSTQLEYALGLHPIFLEQHSPEHLSKLRLTLNRISESNKKPIAIGEIGLDFYLKELDKEQQLFYFEQQLIIAKEHSLPVIIHNRKAHDECLSLLKTHQVAGGVIHAFNGSIEQAEKYCELNFLLGFGGMITYEHSRKLHNLIKRIPLNSIVLETDAPDMSGAKHQGQRNSPEFLTEVLLKAAEIRNCSMNELSDITKQNWHRVFS